MDKSLSKKERKKLKMLQKQKQRQLEQKNKNAEKRKQSGQENKNKDGGDRKKSEGNISIKSKQSNKSKNKNKNKRQKGSQKKSPAEQEVSNHEQQGSLDFNNVLEGEQNVNVQFLISQINQKQYHSMKMILQKYARSTGIMSSQWADAIIANKKAGNSVLTQDDDEQEQEENSEEEQQQNQVDDEEDICNGVISILPYDNKLSKKLIQKISKSVEGKKIKIYGSKQPSQLLTKNNCSVLICERAINLPYEIVKSMHEVLVSDLKQLKKNNSSEYAKICSQYLLCLSQVQIPKGKHEQISPDDIIFTKFEDYLLIKNSSCWWIGQGSPNAVRKVPLHKLYFIISTQKYYSTVGQIHTLLEDQ